MPNHHEIQLHLLGDAEVVADSSPIISVGDTVRYSSPDGRARVFFPGGSPYAVSHVHDGHHHTAKTPGRFEYHCFITPAGKTAEVGWSPDHPKSGGVQEVIPGL